MSAFSDIDASNQQTAQERRDLRERTVKTEYVTDRMWYGYAKRLERKNLRERGRSLTYSGIAARASEFVIELRGEAEPMFVRHGWREAMKAAAEYGDFAS